MVMVQISKSSKLRLEREECERIKHDSAFSEWKTLIGQSDWEDHSLGKEGVEKYRTHNLPLHYPCPGLYELGVARIGGRSCRKHHSDEVIPVYLGQAEDVRTRLQDYGRGGSHLDHGNSIKEKDLSLRRGPGLFKEVFSQGYCIVFRWAPMMNKQVAEKTEAKLLATYDYAWNTRANGVRRREDILLKLNQMTSLSRISLKWWMLPTFSRGMGIIKSNMSSDENSPHNYLKGSVIPGIRKLLTSRPRTVESEACVEARHPTFRRLCEDHDRKGISYTTVSATPVVATTRYEYSSKCGASLEDGSFCMKAPVRGRERCELHKGRKVTQSRRNPSAQNQLSNKSSQGNKSESKGSDAIGDGKFPSMYSDKYICTQKSASGKERSEDHRTKLISGNNSVMSREWCSLEGTKPFCGAPLTNGGSGTKSPAAGNKRCYLHKGMWASCMVTEEHSMNPKAHPNVVNCRELSSSGGRPLSCGAAIGNGGVCTRSPAAGRQRCSQHKGKRAA